MLSKYEAYPYLSERSRVCDYEVMTDKYASEIGIMFSKVVEEDKDTVRSICELVYHMNPSVRNNNAITDEDIKKLEKYMEEYNTYVPKHFVLPLDDSEVSCKFQVLRAKAKEIIRLMYLLKYEGYDVDRKLFDSMNIISQIFFGMAMKYTVSITKFISRTYK